MGKWWIAAVAAALCVGAGVFALVWFEIRPGASAADRAQSRALLVEAEAAVESGDFDAALRSLDESIRLDVQNDALRARAAVHVARRDFDNAQRDLDRVIRRGGGLAETYSQRCYVRAKGENLNGARADCDRAIEMVPTFASAFGSRGLVGLRQGRNREAWNDFNTALRLGGNDGGVSWRVFGRGVAAWRRGNVIAGRQDIETALRSDPSVAADFALFGEGVEIMRELDDATYAGASDPGTLISLRQYLDVYPNGAHVAEARARIDEIYASIAAMEAEGQAALPGFAFAHDRGTGSPEDSFGAIAISRSTWRVAFSTDYDKPDEAQRAAARACNGGAVQDCEAFAFRNVCAALAVSPRNRIRGMAWAYAQDDAVHDALAFCRGRGGANCVAVHSQCTPTPAPDAPR
ncbi:MAG: DUF4189 domain-containing protein [Hyphomonadaceae bacterium]